MLGPAWCEHDLIFCNHHGGPLRGDNLVRDYHKLVAQAGVPYIRIHDQRHTYATWAIAAGVDAKTVSELLGHAGPEITLRLYTHPSKEQHRAAAHAIGGKLLHKNATGPDQAAR